MDFAEPASAPSLRAEIDAFLDRAFPPELREEVYRTGVSHDDGFAAALHERGWLRLERTPDLDPFEIHLIVDELMKVEAPIYAVSTSMMVANVIERVGSEEMKAEVLPAVYRGEATIALGMSEPEAGSDVAAVQTRARWDDDAWVIDGSKMFTTNGHVTDYAFLLARTDPDVPNHRGLTTFLVPLNHPGVEAQAVYTLSGERTNITYYSEVRLDDRWRIGEVNQGWGALMLSLQDEHSAGFVVHLEKMLEATEAWADEDAGAGRPLDDALVAETLTRAATELEVGQLLEQRVTWMESVGQVPVSEGPMAKLFGTEALVRHAERLTELVGPDALRSRLDPTALQHGHIEHGLRFSLGTTIYAGTSEIQRNIIAQRACGLPR
jgi:alkylation response protein AidB-like acyl-CoA dehydrogenase